MDIALSLSPTKSRFGPILFAGDLEQGLRRASELGYSGVELSLLDSSQLDRVSLIGRLQELNLRVLAIATGQTWVTDGCCLYSNDRSRRQRAIDRLKGHIDLAAELKCMVIIGGIRGKIEPSDENTRRRLVLEGRSAIASCAGYAKASGVTVLLEPINRYESDVVNTVDEGLQMISELERDCVKLLPDTYHMNIEERSIPESIVRAGSALGYIHFADSNRWAPGWGHIEFAGILDALRSIDYRGSIGIEVLPLPDDGRAADQAIRYVRKLLNRI